MDSAGEPGVVAGPTVLKTERLVLRPFRLTDVDDVVAYANDEEWQRFLLPLPYPYERVHAEQYIAKAVLTDWDVRPILAVVLDGNVIGGINLRIDKRSQTAELGYSISREHWGNGFATEAARAVVGWGFETYDLAKISSQANIGNERSWRVIESLGMTREGVLRGELPDGRCPGRRQDMACYGVLREEWAQQ